MKKKADLPVNDNKQTYDVILTKNKAAVPETSSEDKNIFENNFSKIKKTVIACNVSMTEARHLKKTLNNNIVQVKVVPHKERKGHELPSAKFVRENIALYESLKDDKEYKISPVDFFFLTVLSIVLCLFVLNVFNSSSRANTELHRAVVRQEANKIKRIIEKHPEDMAVQDEHGRIPLHYIQSDGDIEIAKLLFEHNSPVNVKDKDGMTPIDYIHKNKNKALFYLFLKNGAIQNKTKEPSSD